MTRFAYRGLFFLGLALLLVALWQIFAAQQGLAVTTARSAALPLTIVTPAGVSAGERPLVLIGHGFAGSRTLMRAFAFTLAHAGYATVSWDFGGHGSNENAMLARPLLADVEAALDEATARGLVAPGKVAILGHSMGSGVALQFGVTYSDTAATIAVSPTSYTVTAELPRNLLLMAGSYERNFVRNAESLLAQAGGAGGEPGQGNARRLDVIDGVEHMSILFAPAAHHAVVAWLDDVFGVQPGARAYTDVRMAWYALGAAGVLLMSWGVAGRPWTATLQGRLWGRQRRQPEGPARPFLLRLTALLGGALAATIILWLVSLAGVDLRTLFGVLVGGYVMLWFAVAGLVSLLLMRTWPGVPSLRAVTGGLLAFAALWLAIGLLAELVWFPWLLVWPRLRLWPLAALCLLPWFMAAGQVVGGSGLLSSLGRWLVHSIVLAAGLFLSMQLTPGIGFLMLILPVLPVLFLVHALAAAPQRGWQPFALSGALFTSWMLLAIFPLQ